jgi:histidinol-phosphatase (PHP family)
MVSMHGGHSGEFCDHAEGTLRQMLDAAIEAGYHTFGVSEHAPRWEDRFMYPNERNLGWTVEKTLLDFERYMNILPKVAAEYEGRLNVVRGFECEVVPDQTYVTQTRMYSEQIIADQTTPAGSAARLFDYFVGSVHYVGEIPIDGAAELWEQAAELHGGPENLAVAYYAAVARMVDALHPDVVGHLDLIKLNAARAGFDPAAVTTSRAIAAAESALESILACNGILDLNTAGWRKGLAEPYPAPWLVRRAAAMGIPFSFGDDSHRPSQVGYGIDRARTYLLENGVNSVTCITSGGERVKLGLF